MTKKAIKTALLNITMITPSTAKLPKQSQCLVSGINAWDEEVKMIISLSAGEVLTRVQAIETINTPVEEMFPELSCPQLQFLKTGTEALCECDS